MTRIAALLLILASAPALAQTGGTGGTAPNPASSLTSADFLFELRRQEGEEWVRITDFERERFFNSARCTCKTPVRITIGLTPSGAAKKQTIKRGDVTIVAGNDDCVAEVAARANAKCIQIGDTINLVGLLQNARESRDTTVDVLFGNTAEGCLGARRTENLRLLVDVDQNDEPDLLGGAAPNLPIELDSEPPSPPTGIKVTAGNEALEVSWDSEDGQDDFLGYVVLCSRGEDMVVFSPTLYKDEYQTEATTCGGDVMGATQALRADATHNGAPQFDLADPARRQDLLARLAPQAAAPGVHAASNLPSIGLGPFNAPAHFVNLHPQYLCSALLSTQSSTRIAVLQNDISYLVGVASVDKKFNASPIHSVYLQAPIATRDFYRGYVAAGGEAEGGFCSVVGARRSSRRSPVSLLFFAAVVGGTAFALRTRGRRR